MGFRGKSDFRKLSGPTIEISLDGSARGIWETGEGDEESPVRCFLLELGGTERVGGGNPAPGFGAVEAEGADTKGNGLRRGQRFGESGDREGEKS